MKKLIALVVMSLCGIAFADDVTWTGGAGEGDTSWANPDNWSAAPQEGDTAIIPAGVSLKAVASDKETFALFSSFDIREGAQLVVWQFGVEVSQNLKGAGDLVLVGIKDAKMGMTLSGDNREFTGEFFTTNVHTGVHSKYALGTTNVVHVYGQGSDMYSQQIKVPSPGEWTGSVPSVISNELHFVSDQYVAQFYVGRNPMYFYGPVYGDGGSPCFYPGAGTAYQAKLYGGLHGTKLAALGANADFCLIELLGGPVDIGRLTARAGGFLIGTKIDGTTLEAGREGYGFRFSAENVACTNAPWVFNEGSGYDSGGYFDLNGKNQEIGDLVVHGTAAASYGKVIIRSAEPATLTVRGSMGRKYGSYNLFPGVLKGQLSFVYDWDGRVGPTVKQGSNAWTNPAGVFTFTDSVSTTTGAVVCANGALTIAATASLPCITNLSALVNGSLTVNSTAVGTSYDTPTLTVRVSDNATLTIGEGVTLAAKTAFLGRWIDPEPGATYGGPDSAATVKLSCLAGTGVMTVAEYGGPKGLMLILR